MLIHPTDSTACASLGLDGMAKAFLRPRRPILKLRALEHAEWLGLLIDQRGDRCASNKRSRAARLSHGQAASGRGGGGHRLPCTARSGPCPVPANSPAVTGSVVAPAPA